MTFLAVVAFQRSTSFVPVNASITSNKREGNGTNMIGHAILMRLILYLLINISVQSKFNYSQSISFESDSLEQFETTLKSCLGDHCSNFTQKKNQKKPNLNLYTDSDYERVGLLGNPLSGAIVYIHIHIHIYVNIY
jgi:hypothetical protein